MKAKAKNNLCWYGIIVHKKGKVFDLFPRPVIPSDKWMVDKYGLAVKLDDVEILEAALSVEQDLEINASDTRP